MNIRLFKAADKLWNKIEIKEPILYNSSLAENLNNLKDHNWWPRAADLISKGRPTPIYV